MAGNKRIFVSDIHMGAGWGLQPEPGKSPYDWLGASEAATFADLVRHVANGEDVKEVVLLGDLMDNWVCPVDTVPPTFEQIVDAPHNRVVVDALAALVKAGKSVVYLPGNHDMGVTAEFVGARLPGVKFGGPADRNSVFRTGRLRAEHGSAHALFNAPDPANHPARLPLGYFISRVVATAMRDTGRMIRHYWTLADDILEMLGPQKLAASVFEAVLEEAGLSEQSDILMPDRGADPRKVTAGEVKARYADLYDQWKQHRGAGVAFKGIMAEIGWLGDIADKLCKKGDTNVVIFGHSHDWALDKDSAFVAPRIYANCGAWCDEDKPRTFVETEKDEASREHRVRVMEWLGDGRVKRLAEESVAL